MLLPSSSSSTTAPRSMASSSMTRLHLSKSLRRTMRTVRTEWRLFRSKPFRRRPWTFPLLFLLLSIFLLFLLFRLYLLLHPLIAYIEPAREDSHFSHNVHLLLPRTADIAAVRKRRCSWLYAEFGARDGRFLDGFVENGNGFLEEFLRGSQSSMRAFCLIAFEPDPAMQAPLMTVRNSKAKRALHLDVFTEHVPGNHDGREQVAFVQQHSQEGAVKTTQRSKALVNTVSIVDFLNDVTFEWPQSGREVPKMNTARGNGNNGTVVIRFNVATAREAMWYLDTLQAASAFGPMCQRVDRLVLNFEKARIHPDRAFGEMQDRVLERDWETIITPPSSEKYNPSNSNNGGGFEAVVRLANEINALHNCRTTLHVINEHGKVVTPPIVSEREVFYAILAGQPTFDERVGAQTVTWMTAVPQDRLTIFTNQPRNADEMKAANGRHVAVVHPTRPDLEKRLPLMQSWSHLVRVRESWDRVLKHNPEIKWLALVDDDTFVFPGGLREYLSKFDHRLAIWGGSGEMARIENGDGGQFATWLRNIHLSFGGRHCYLDSETVPRKHQGVHIEYDISKVLNGRRVAKKVSHMCHDTFCKLGCPAVPQGAAIVLSRALVERLRPHIETCESATVDLCKNCGSQRLYMCVNRFAAPARTILTRGICRAPWKLEHREKFPFALTYHGFNRYHGMFLSTDSLHGDMVELWQLGKSVEEAAKQGLRESSTVSMSSVADILGCHGTGRYVRGSCITKDDIRLESTDGNPKKDRARAGHRASDRKGSA